MSAPKKKGRQTVRHVDLSHEKLTNHADPLLVKGDMIIRMGSFSLAVKQNGWAMGLCVSALTVLACVLGFGFLAYGVGAPVWGCLAAGGVGLMSAGSLIWVFTRLLSTSNQRSPQRNRKR